MNGKWGNNKSSLQTLQTWFLWAPPDVLWCFLCCRVATASQKNVIQGSFGDSSGSIPLKWRTQFDREHSWLLLQHWAFLRELYALQKFTNVCKFKHFLWPMCINVYFQNCSMTSPNSITFQGFQGPTGTPSLVALLWMVKQEAHTTTLAALVLQMITPHKPQPRHEQVALMFVQFREFSKSDLEHLHAQTFKPIALEMTQPVIGQTTTPQWRQMTEHSIGIIPSEYINEPIVGAEERHGRTRRCHVKPSFQEIVEDIQHHFMRSDYERMAPLHFPQTSSSESATYKYKTLWVKSSERNVAF